MISDNENKLLKKFNWVYEKTSINNDEFTVTSENGCQIRNSIDALKFLLLDLKEREIEDRVEFESVESIFNHFGYELVCESPLEVVKRNNKEFISGEAAMILLSNLRSKKTNAQ